MEPNSIHLPAGAHTRTRVHTGRAQTGAQAHPAWSKYVCMLACLDTSHSRTVLSSEAVATRRPSGLNSAERTQLEWPEESERRKGEEGVGHACASSPMITAPLSEHMNRLEGRDHSFAVLSSEAVRSWAPSQEKRTDRTGPCSDDLVQ